MLEFAVIDDSSVSRNGLYTYSHALVLAEDTPRTKTFFTNSSYNHKIERELIDFIENNVYQGFPIYACGHYRQYIQLWKQFDIQYVKYNEVPRIVRQHFAIAHHTANHTAKMELDNLIKKN